MGDMLGSAVSALLSSQRALATTSHNISNVNTPGYSRQRVELGTRPASEFGFGFVGNGVNVENISRAYDQFVVDQLRGNTTLNAQLTALHEFSLQVDNLLADPNAGLSPSLQSFFDSVQGVADDPSSLPARQVLLTEGEALSSRFQFLDNRLRDLDGVVNSQISNSVSSINGLAQSIANINQEISSRSSSTTGLPNDLLDQRDELVRQLSELISVSTVDQGNGDLNIFAGNGIGLVVGGRASSLTTIQNEFNVTEVEVGLLTPSGATINITNNVSGGVLGGALDFKQNVLDPAINSLGQIAITLSDTFNDQHQLGQDLNGQLGGLFFNDIATSSPRSLASINNGGNATLSLAVTDPTALTADDYLLEFVGGAYTMTNQRTNVATALAGFPGAAETVDGITLSIAAGAMNAGDRILIQPTASAAKDFGLQINNATDIAAAAPVRSSASIANLGNATIAQPVVNAPPPTDPNLQEAVTITFNNPPITFNVVGVGTGNPVGVGFVDGGNITYNGFTMQIDGAPLAGDTFTISSNVGGVSDNRNALSLASLQTQQIVNGNADFQTSYSQLVAGVGAKTNQAGVNRDAQAVLLAQSTEARESVSGVNLDEEAANLIKFQQAYQAAAQVISAADAIFQSLLGAVRR